MSTATIAAPAAKKITRATFASFIKKNRANLFVLTASKFDAMQDMVDSTGERSFSPATPRTFWSNEAHAFVPAKEDDRNHYGINGVWLVGSSGNWFQHFENDEFVGINVYNCCGDFTVAVKKA